MIRKSTLVTLCVLSGSACQAHLSASDRASLKAEANSDELPPITCAVGEATSFSLNPLNPMPPDSAIATDSPHELTAPGEGLVRFDTCVSDAEVKLIRVVYRTGPLFPILAYDATTPASLVKGLSEAVFGDYSKLEIAVPTLTPDIVDGIWIKGWSFQGKPFATTTRALRHPDGTVEVFTLNWLTGTIVPGDPFSTLQCPSSQQFKTGSFKLGTAVIATERCEFLGGGQTTGYRIIKLTATDSNSALPVAARQPQVFASETEVQGHLTFKYNHHNACDSFVLKLPAVEYAATSAATAGSAEVVPGAPPCSTAVDGQGTHYSVQYNGQPKTSGQLAGCEHYFLKCPQP